MQDKIRIAEDVESQINGLIGQGLMKCNDHGQVSIIQDANERAHLQTKQHQSQHSQQDPIDGGQSFASLSNQGQDDHGDQFQEAMDQ